MFRSGYKSDDPGIRDPQFEMSRTEIMRPDRGCPNLAFIMQKKRTISPDFFPISSFKENIHLYPPLLLHDKIRILVLGKEEVGLPADP